MKKICLLSMAAITFLSANGIDDAFKNGKANGQIRGAYVNQNNAASTDTYGTALGGQLKYETAAWNNLKLGAAAYVSQKMHFASGDNDRSELNGDLFDVDGKSYAYLGEAYADYSMDDFSLRVGRQQLDTPFADTDDIRMHPNTHEAAIVTYNGIDKTTIIGGFITRWAGYDYSATDKTHFSKPAEGSHGAAVVGIRNESIENLNLQGWYYAVDKIANIAYVDGTYGIDLASDTNLEVSMQYINFSEDNNASAEGSGTQGSVCGASIALTKGMVSIGAAYNRVNNKDGKSVSNGLGGGPYFTSMEEWTLADMEDAKAYQLNATLDLKDAGLEGLTLTALYGDFRSVPSNLRVNETDFIAMYQINEAFAAEMSYASVRDRNDNASDGSDAGYDRFLVRLSYNF